MKLKERGKSWKLKDIEELLQHEQAASIDSLSIYIEDEGISVVSENTSA
jgi:hypothetical protein